MDMIASRPHLTTRALGTFAGLLILILASGFAQPASANAASAAGYYNFQLDNDRCSDAARWWNGSRWLGYFWLDTNNDCTYGETYVTDADNNGTGDLYWMRRGNAGNWATLIDIQSSMVYRGQNGTGDYLHEGPHGTWWSAYGPYQTTVGPATNPSGALNLANAFVRQGYIWYG